MPGSNFTQSIMSRNSLLSFQFNTHFSYLCLEYIFAYPFRFSFHPDNHNDFDDIYYNVTAVILSFFFQVTELITKRYVRYLDFSIIDNLPRGVIGNLKILVLFRK